MPKFGIHAMVWVGDWSAASAERAIAGAAAAGYDFIEIPLLDPDRIDIAHTRSLLGEHGIGARVSLGLAPDCDVSSTDRATVERGRALLMKALSATTGVGGDFLGGVIYSALKKYTAPAGKGNYDSAVGVIRELAQEARKGGVTLGMEAVNRYETNLLNTGADTLRFLDAVGEDNVVVHLDTFHMNIEEADFAASIRQCGDRLGYFHVNENHRGYLGTGVLPHAAIFRALVAAGYEGPIGFEAFSSAVGSEMLSGMVASWRDLWSDSDAIAGHALGFMRREYESAWDAVS
jgi:D-psicose/D-tagatose/L-ribulose 3-epimerase